MESTALSPPEAPPVPGAAPCRIDVRRLGKRYRIGDRELCAVDDVSFEIQKGEFVSLLGPSGCGKSTILNMIATLIEASSGEIRIDDQRSVRGKPHPKVGYVFQKDTLFPWRTVADNIGYPLELAGVPLRERKERVAVALEQASLARFGEFYPAALSGGMRQRASLMRTLISQPEILLMDEPFGALDTHTKLDMHEVLLDLWGKQKQTVLFVTHDLGEALTLSDRIILLSAHPGRIKQTFRVDFPRPRNAVTLRESSSYGALFSTVWHSLGEEFAKAEKP